MLILFLVSTQRTTKVGRPGGGLTIARPGSSEAVRRPGGGVSVARPDAATGVTP